MGRRSLPKIDQETDLSSHLFAVDDLASPFDPQTLFPKNQPLEIEVGSGKGHFLLQHSERQIDTNYLGNEIASKYAQFSAYRLAKNDRNNARVISGDGLRLFHEYLPVECTTGVHVYFPDPWWKERHRRRRIMQQEFVVDVQRVLVPGGRLHFWTDVEEYFDSTLRLIEECSDLSGPDKVETEDPLHDMDYRTHFERRMRKNGHDVFRAQFVKRT